MPLAVIMTVHIVYLQHLSRPAADLCIMVSFNTEFLIQTIEKYVDDVKMTNFTSIREYSLVHLYYSRFKCCNVNAEARWNTTFDQKDHKDEFHL